jgi:VIT1/CCC1 family predicted Fe2+/Mn2+ transporter
MMKFRAILSPSDRFSEILFGRLKPIENHTSATRDDMRGGIAAGMLVFISGIPLLLPFVFLDDIWVMWEEASSGLALL